MTKNCLEGIKEQLGEIALQYWKYQLSSGGLCNIAMKQRQSFPQAMLMGGNSGVLCILNLYRVHLLDFVLGVGFPTAALHLSRVQETVFPYGVGPITGQGLNHLKYTHTAMTEWYKKIVTIISVQVC